jgi:CubicO group peptidase (beta-lactamase class C family)
VWLKRVYNDQTPPSGLIGPGTDAARLMTAYLNGGELEGRRILSRESIAAMTLEGHMSEKQGGRSTKQQVAGYRLGGQ